MLLPGSCLARAPELPVAAPICDPSNPARGDAHSYSFDPGVAFNASALLPPVKFCSENGVQSWPGTRPPQSFFQGEELAKLVRGVEALRQRNQQSAQTSTDGVPIVAEADPTCLELLDHPRVLPYVVDAVGWNIHARDCLFTAQPPRSGAATPGRLALPWHHDQEEEFTGLTQDGTMPLVELKVSYYLSDHAEAGHACTLVVPGSHRWSAEQRASWERTLRPALVVPLRVPLGSVMLWRSSLLHSVAPHLAGSWRHHLFVSYIPRWVRPSHRGNFSTAGHPDPARNGPLLARS